MCNSAKVPGSTHRRATQKVWEFVPAGGEIWRFSGPEILDFSSFRPARNLPDARPLLFMLMRYDVTKMQTIRLLVLPGTAKNHVIMIFQGADAQQ